MCGGEGGGREVKGGRGEGGSSGVARGGLGGQLHPLF